MSAGIGKMETNPYLVTNAPDAKMAEYTRLHCHDIVVPSKAGPLKARVWDENCLDLRRNIIEKWTPVESVPLVQSWHEKDSQEEEEGGWSRGGYDWGGPAHTPYIRDKDEIETLIRNKQRFIEYCERIIPISDFNDCFMIAEVQRSYEERGILVKFDLKECCQGSPEHAILLNKVEDYCLILSDLDPSKLLVTIRGSHDAFVTRRKNKNQNSRRQIMIQFYKDHGYRLLPWKCCVSEGQGGKLVDAFSKHLSNPALDTDGKLFCS